MKFKAIFASIIITGILITGLAAHSTLQASSFDCAEQFDKMAFAYQWVKDKHPQRYTTQMIDYTTELGRTFMDNHCSKTLNDWSDDSQHQQISGIDWKMAQHLERLYHHEEECPINYDPICAIKYSSP